MTLTGAQRKKLRGLAHHIDPVVIVGQNGLTDSVTKAIDEALTLHELIKIKFNDHKEDRKNLARDVSTRLVGELVGEIGNIAILFRQNEDPEKRKIKI